MTRETFEAMTTRENSEKVEEEPRSGGKGRLAIMLSSTLAVGFLLGYVASAFVPLVPQPQSAATSTSAAPGPKLSPSEIDSALKRPTPRSKPVTSTRPGTNIIRF